MAVLAEVNLAAWRASLRRYKATVIHREAVLLCDTLGSTSEAGKMSARAKRASLTFVFWLAMYFAMTLSVKLPELLQK